MAKHNNITILLVVALTSLAFSQDVGGKCETWRGFERLKNKMQQKQELQSVTRPISHRSIVSPSGRFRIHYDTTGMHEPTMVTTNGNPIPNSYREYVDSVAGIFDEVFQIEIEIYGYPVPASDGASGGGSEYDVYIENLGTGNYGYTEWDEEQNITPGKTNPQFPCFIVIDNNFESGYYTTGLNAVRVTAAHEFHHMIEVSTSGVWYDDFYFYEMCATGIESTVYPEIRDYIQYIKTYYNNTTQWPLFTQVSKSGYERGIFPKFLMERFGPGIMNTIWNEVKNHRPVQATQNALQIFSTSIEREFSEFTIWNYYTNYRTDSTGYFKDAKLFPLIKPFAFDSISTSQTLFQSGIKSFTIHLNRLLSKQATVDTVDFLIANTNFNDALNSTNQTFFYDISVSPSSIQGHQPISNNVFVKFSVQDMTNWKFTAIAKGGIVQKNVSAVFPNPFDPTASALLIPLGNFLPDNRNSLQIYSVSMDLIYSKQAKYASFSGIQYARWNGRDDKGNIVPTGIYLYVLARDGEYLKGKFAVIR
ncbi:MAG: hypothetical protein HYV29_07860 [Ignavibacteriales bacterium]|nr:hypothetical protein [Ignavibacteriales bacterium]